MTGAEFLKEDNVIVLVSKQKDPKFNVETNFDFLPCPGVGCSEKLYRLSRNFPGNPETFRAFQKISRLSGIFPGYPEIFQGV